MRVLLDRHDVTRGLRRVAGEIAERHRGGSDLVLVAIRRGGISVTRELLHWLRELEHCDVATGTVDITLYRDDVAMALPNPRVGPTKLPFALDGKIVVLVDDVVFTGRTVRAAIDALMDYGRPRRIELAALVDRGGRELPVQPDYVVRATEVRDDERVDVFDDPVEGLRAIIQPNSAPSIPPGVS
jgi:pyrimidine operon attenuation protein / uracil phosphoribosyltransferase